MPGSAVREDDSHKRAGVCISRRNLEAGERRQFARQCVDRVDDVRAKLGGRGFDRHLGTHGKRRIFVGELRRAGGKAIVLLNRRGWSNFLSCRSCGRVWSCPECDVELEVTQTHPVHLIAISDDDEDEEEDEESSTEEKEEEKEEEEEEETE